MLNNTLVLFLSQSIISVSETVSIELQTLRREYESLVQKTAELESAKRNADLRYRDCKSSNKRLQTELQEKNTLIEKLRETYSKDKRTQYLFDEMKAEHTRLVRDYEILRQTYNQKEQQVQSMLMEQAELQRKLDACECERRQLEHRLYSQPVSSRVVKQTDTQ
ncbi:unnamed protein product [Dicrocoelium dendriticum]|nr:unnamed protein product [Dicrocoelium dendriticum]